MIRWVVAQEEGASTRRRRVRRAPRTADKGERYDEETDGDVGEILHDSPNVFWITRGQVYLGRDAVLKRFEEYYQGTWAAEPRTGEIKVFELSPGVAQLFAPTIFRIAPAGQIAQPALFFLNQVYVMTPGGWRLASIFPILVP
jgi:hypothetical protein